MSKLRRPTLAVAGLLCLATALPSTAISQTETQSRLEALEAEAEAGSFDAMLRLGLAYDTGNGVATDRRKALDWYLKAARAGEPNAQFNVAVMIDAGLVPGAYDLETAFHWYTRAATNGQPRAQYNLGLIYANGDGLEANTELARYWFTKAADGLDAAKAKLASLPTEGPDADLAAPIETVGAIVEIDSGAFAEMTWIAPPGPKGSFFEVEILAWSDDLATWSQPVFTDRTNGNGIVTVLDVNADLFAWRVAMVEPVTASSSASDWKLMGQGTQDLPIQTAFQSRTIDPDPGNAIVNRLKDAMTEDTDQ